MGQLKVVIPNMNVTFGKLSFAGLAKETTRRVNGRQAVQQREYSLFSSVQRAENVAVRIPGKAGAKTFDYEEPVKLVNPHLIAEGYSIQGRGYVNYVLTADDIVKA